MTRMTLRGGRVVLRPLRLGDFEAFRATRLRNVDWLARWEPGRPPGQADAAESKEAFGVRCSARQREWQLGTGYGFGMFVDDELVGEINLSAVQRGPFQSTYLGYWVAQEQAGNGYCPEAVVLALQFAFDDLELQRVQIAIVPRNTPSRRVVEKLAIREEGIARGYLEIAGRREDHVRYGMTADEWALRRDELLNHWVGLTSRV